jgi:hypothetical protein
MSNYETLSEATNALKQKGFTEDFNQWDQDRLLKYVNGEGDKDIEIVEFYRFEGTSDMGSNTILYALKTSDGTQGVLIDAYGTYSGQTVSKEVVKGLEIHRQAYEKKS